MTAPAFIYTSEPWAALSFGRPIFAPAFTREQMESDARMRVALLLIAFALP